MIPGEPTAASFGELFAQFASMASHTFWVYDLDPHERVVYVSPSFERVWGRKAQDLYACHRLWMDSMHPEDRPAMEKAYAHWLSQTAHDTYAFEFRIVRPDGGVRWIFEHGRRICDASGKAVRVIGIAEDLTERKNAEAALRASEERFRQLADSLPQMVFTADAEGRCDFVNQRWLEFSGLAEAQLLGDKWLACIHPDERASLVALWRHCVATGTPYRGEHRILSNAGRYRWFSTRAVPVRDADGRVVRWCGSNTDVHDEHMLRESLRTERDRLTTIAASAPGVLCSFRVDPDGRMSFPYASAKISEIFGLPLEALQRDGTLAFERMHSEDRARVQAAMEHSLRNLTYFQEEYRVAHPARGEIWVEGRSVPRREDDGTVMWHGLLTDITARKRAERLQLHSQKMEALGTLAGGIAHDFNNILLAISGNTQLAMDDLPSGSPAIMSLAEVHRAASRATDLVRQILSFSHQREAKREVVALRPIVEEALQLLRSTLPAMVRIVARFEPSVPQAAVDATQIHQIIMNLATNAAHAIGDGAGVLEVAVDAVTVGPDEIVASPDLHAGRYARIAVSDSGCGMDHATLERIFDPFFSTKPPGQGTGLGLSVVHGIVRGHEGAITVYSQPGKGSTFRIYLPVSAEIAPEPPRTEPAARGGAGERIMYVDDEDALVFLGERVLERLGYEVRGYTDPAQALKDFQAQPQDFDAVVTDLSMPGMSGFHLAQALLQIRPDLPIVLTTGYVRPEDKETARHRGIRELILKPDTIEELGRTLDRLLREMREKS
ncbi:MAG TPA: PAS domain-containing protein [Povalibacter sp.]|nr:PAS domain-containing protein [Povalibacter sp.]